MIWQINVKSCFDVLLFSSHEPKAHRWTYSIGRHPSSGVCLRTTFQTISPLKPWGRFLPNFTYSIYRPGKRIIVFFLFQSDRNFGCMATYTSWLIMGKVELGFIAISLQIFWQNNYRNIHWVVLYQPYKYSKIFSSKAIRGMKLKL